MSANPWIIVLSLCIGSVFGVSPCRDAHATEYTVQKRDDRFSSYYEIGSEGNVLGTVVRERWKQPFRAHYQLYDVNTKLQGEAITPLLSWGRVFSWATRLDLYDANGQHMYFLVGDVFTAETAVFRLKTSDGRVLAVLHVDLASSGCVATRPDSRFAVLARYYRNQITDYTYERWDYTTALDSPVDSVTWQLIGAFLSDQLS